MSMFQVTPASSAARPALELTEAPLCAFIAAEQARWGGIARRAGMAAE